MAPFDDSAADQVHSQDQDHLSLPIFLDLQSDDELPHPSPDLEGDEDDDHDHDHDPERRRLSTGIPKGFTMADLRDMNVPIHPIPAMQGAFAESMHDASAVSTPISRNVASDAIERRKILLGQDVTEETHAARWRQRPGQEYHELWKLIAQISFGVHLLLYGMAKDEHQVSSILQGHVDEVDEFLQATLEDFDLALEDVDERLKFLKLPLENLKLFDSMLEDRQFRLQIINGNEQIEHIISRTVSAMKDAHKDIVQGLDATEEFTRYLDSEQQSAVWLHERPDAQKVFNAMKGNADGWNLAFVSLQTKSNQLGIGLTQLGSIVAEMDRRAGDVSRNTRFSIAPGAHPASPVSLASSHLQSPPRQMYNHNQQTSRSLPAPKLVTSPIETTLPAFQYVPDRAQEYTQSPESEHRISSDFESNSPTLAPALRFSPVPEPAEFTLQPRVYTPIPSPSASPKPQERVVPTQTPKEVNRKSSLRQRFSLRGRKASASQPQRTQADPRPIANILTPPTSGGGRKDSLNGSDSDKSQFTYSSHDTYASQSLRTSRSRPDIRSDARSISSRTDIRSVASRPELRPSRIEMPLPPRLQLSHRPSEPSLSSLNSQSSLHQPFSRPELHQRPSNPNFSSFNNNLLPSPRSETYFSFTPVQANPNSPLQRPWTAAPSPMQPPPSRHAPSTMGMSVRSEMSSMTTDTQGQKVKKKRSGFGWLKKAFSLSEEEKAAFEARRRGLDQDYMQPRETPRFLDGKRIDRDRDGRSIRSGHMR